MGKREFYEAGRKLMTLHPDLNDTLLAADRDGLSISPEAVAELIRLARPDIAYFLCRPENREYGVKIHNMAPDEQTREMGAIARQLDESQSLAQPEMDEYIEQRKQRRAKRFA